jgi:hypothetical protein
MKAGANKNFPSRRYHRLTFTDETERSVTWTNTSTLEKESQKVASRKKGHCKCLYLPLLGKRDSLS